VKGGPSLQVVSTSPSQDETPTPAQHLFKRPEWNSMLCARKTDRGEQQDRQGETKGLADPPAILNTVPAASTRWAHTVTFTLDIRHVRRRQSCKKSKAKCREAFCAHLNPGRARKGCKSGLGSCLLIPLLWSFHGRPASPALSARRRRRTV